MFGRLARVSVTVACLVSSPALSAAQQPDSGSPPFDQAAAIAQLQQSIAGKEDHPTGEVFKNIQQYKGVSAARFLRLMEFSFSRALGVTCTHCHVPGQWELDAKMTKQIARQMTTMLNAINNEHLKKIPNLRSTNPSVNCTTCHRGQTRPALDLPAPAAKSPGL